MIFDTHMHTIFSSDSKMSINEVINTSNSLNLGVCITEHMDLDYPEENEFKCDIPKYLEDYNNYRSHSLLLGLEIGMTKNMLLENEALASKYDFDYILGSIHTVDGLDIYHTFHSNELPNKDFCKRYYENMLYCVENYNSFDSLGHIDYLFRYLPFPNNEINIEPYKEIIEAIFLNLIKKDKAIEINTRRLSNLDSVNALLDTYRFYKELGGKYVTIGSDAHFSSAIGNNIKEALNIVDQLSLKPVYYKDRKINYFD